ncbi:MAG: NAD-dependent epimerase/dehydratase family protein [Betaproteobacteria bacterium]
MIIASDIKAILAEDIGWHRFLGKTVLVSGAAGFLPAYMVETLLELARRNPANPPHVVGLVRNLEAARTRLGDNPFLTLLEQDMGEPLNYDGAADFVIHAASQASPRFYRDDPVGTFNANVFGTQSLLALSRGRKTQAFLFFSSGEVYGNAPIVPTPENVFGPIDPAALRSCYGEGKRAGETLCVAWAHQHGVPTRIVRPFHTYGPGMKLDDGRVFADFVAAIIARRDIVIKSDGKARRPFCYSADAVRAFFRVLLEGGDGIPYNVGNDQAELSIRELADLLVAEFSERDLRVIMDASQIAANYMQSPIVRNCPDISRLRELGWVPRTGVAEGFRRTVTAYEESGTG